MKYIGLTTQGTQCTAAAMFVSVQYRALLTFNGQATVFKWRRN